MKQLIGIFYFLFPHSEYDWNLAFPIDIAAFNLKVYFNLN